MNNTQVQPCAMSQDYNFKPSYNAVQLNIKKPTLNAEQTASPQVTLPQQCNNSWIA